MHEITVRTNWSREARDVTDLVTAALPAGADGFWWLAVPHTTCALLLSENDDDLLRDLERAAGAIFAPLEPFSHHKNDNPNAAAHIFASMLGASMTVPVRSGQLVLGTYQRLVLLELDGPKARKIRVAPISW